MFIAALFMVARTQKKLTIDDWITKLWYIYAMEYYSTIRKILLFVTTWIDLEIVILSEISQTVKVENHMISLICEIKT